MTVRAHDRTGVAAADFSRIRNAGPVRFTNDSLMSTINRLGLPVEVKIPGRGLNRSRAKRNLPVFGIV